MDQNEISESKQLKIRSSKSHNPVTERSTMNSNDAETNQSQFKSGHTDVKTENSTYSTTLSISDGSLLNSTAAPTCSQCYDLGFDIHNVRAHASWIARIHRIDETRVLHALLQTSFFVDYDNSYGDFRSVKFSPSLETALKYLRPEVALDIFLSDELCIMSKIGKWLVDAETYFGNIVKNPVSIEDLRAYEQEFHY